MNQAMTFPGRRDVGNAVPWTEIELLDRGAAGVAAGTGETRFVVVSFGFALVGCSGPAGIPGCSLWMVPALDAGALAGILYEVGPNAAGSFVRQGLFFPGITSAGGGELPEATPAVVFSEGR